MIIGMDAVTKLRRAEYCTVIREHNDGAARAERAAAMFADLCGVEVNPEDVYVAHQHGDYLGAPVYYSWDPGQRGCAYFAGPADGRLAPDTDHHQVAVVEVYDRDAAVGGNKVVIERVRYVLGGYDTGSRRWVLIPEGMVL